MKHPWQTWLAFALCAAVLLASLGWLSGKVLHLGRAESLARQQAVLEENSRLALWRMDSALTALVARENAVPYYAYASLLPDATPPTPQSTVPGSRGPLPSPLLLNAAREVKLHFQVNADGGLASPQVPRGDERDAVSPHSVDSARIDRHARLLAQLVEAASATELVGRLPELGPPPSGLSWSPPLVAEQSAIRTLPPNSSEQLQEIFQQQSAVQQQARSAGEFQVRSQVLLQNTIVNQGIADYAPLPGGAGFLNADSATGVMTPVWLKDELFLGRHVLVQGERLTQACWLDWPAIREDLLASVRDLLPAADLRRAPAGNGSPEMRAHLLAALPVELRPGVLPHVEISVWVTPLGIALTVAWCALIGILVAGAVLLRGILALSERRAAFVSAVTHELRTPLTTFRLYVEMLEGGMVTAEADRRSYFATLRREADRLMHLVENVLAYARLERGPTRGRLVVVTVAELLHSVEPRLRERVAASEMQLVAVPGDAAGLRVRTDPGAVEQILFNLIDNACKYAGGRGKQVVLEAAAGGRMFRLRVRDSGPGLTPQQRRRLFQPFRKSASEAAGSAAGVGLGLALCRRLVREIGGDLRLDSSDAHGTSFVLLLPIAVRI